MLACAIAFVQAARQSSNSTAGIRSITVAKTLTLVAQFQAFI
jgi:hypothetical protein